MSLLLGCIYRLDALPGPARSLCAKNWLVAGASDSCFSSSPHIAKTGVWSSLASYRGRDQVEQSAGAAGRKQTRISPVNLAWRTATKPPSLRAEPG